MAITARESDDGKSVTILVNERFDFSGHREFRDAYRNRDALDLVYRVDLSTAEYMDSSALGMLLLLKEHADSKKSRVVLVQPSPAISQVLTLANFNQLFDIES